TKVTRAFCDFCAFLWLIFLFFKPPLSYRFSEALQERDRFLPANTRIRDALAVNEFFSGKQILAAGLQVTLNHHSDDPIVALRDLACHFLTDIHLAQVVLLTVRVTQIDHRMLADS